MNNDKKFIIAIGGTGMRCLESFVHLCAAGMFDNEEIDILTLDTDQSNGNKGRVEELIDLYNKVKTNDMANRGGQPRSDTFFSAKLNLYSFYTDYSKPERRTYDALAQQTPGLKQKDRDDNRDLADLFYDRGSVQEFDLTHGYRAQTHLGSMLMYHGIVEAARNVSESTAKAKPNELALRDFLNQLNKNANSARVFVFGSVFGGTGASSIPVIPLALRDALEILTKGVNRINLDKVKFGSTLLTDYFDFTSPTQEERKREKLIADSKNFALSSQAALSFYNADSTVMNTYKCLYHIGWPTSLKADYSHPGNVITGGKEQANDCHVAELMCASAAFDFFNMENLNKRGAQYLFRTVGTQSDDPNGPLKLTGASFVGDQHKEEFENKLGALLSFVHIILSRYRNGGIRAFLDDLSTRDIHDFDTLTNEQTDELQKYLRCFGYAYDQRGLAPGWIYQITKSLKNGKFIFTDDSLTTDVNSLKKVDPGYVLEDENHQWSEYKRYLGIGSSRPDVDKTYSTFVDELRRQTYYDGQGETVKEQFLARIYNTLTSLQNFQTAEAY